MTMSGPPLPGGHDIGPAFGGVGAFPLPPRHRKRTGLILAAVGVVVLGIVCAGLQWGANLGYDAAVEEFDDAAAGASTSRTQLEQKVTNSADTSDAASAIQEADTGNLMDAEAREALDAAVDEASDAASHASELADEPLPAAGEKPTWAWELFGETSRLNEGRDAMTEQRSDFESAYSDLESASAAVDDAGVAAVLTAADAAGAFESAHVSARNTDILDLRYAADWLDDTAEVVDGDTADAYIDLETAAVAMLASEKEELAEKQGSLYKARIEIEAFARELAPEVLLDFDWSPIVNGFGEADSMAGYATWWYGEPGYANIELTNSVAEQWPSARSKALVAHEVGHAISVKCEGAYDDSNQDTIEAWATAWAISMGFTDEANGTSAYGAPPQSLIKAAAGCR